MKSRFFHLRNPFNVLRGGATVLVTPLQEDPFCVQVQSTFCSKKDLFCRKTGRQQAELAPKEIIALRDLGTYLYNIEDRMLCRVLLQCKKHPEVRDNYIHNWDFAIRYFLPKVVT